MRNVLGEDNVLADRISRLHEPEARQYLTIYRGTCPIMGFCIFWTGRGFLDSLDDKVRWLQEQVFAPSTRVTYASQRRLYQHFCVLGDINPVPLSQDNACRYIAFLSQKLAYTSIKQYINVIRIMHLDAGHANPFQGSWHIDMLLKGTKRVSGTAHNSSYPSPVV